MSRKQWAEMLVGALLLFVVILLASPAQAAEGVSIGTLDDAIPDLQISDSDVQFDPNPVLESGTITAIISVTNNGSSPAANVLVQAYNGDPDSGGTPIENGTISEIAVGETVVDTSIVFIDETAGIYDVYIVVDPNNDIPEVDENNNKAQATLTVMDDDMVPPQISNVQIAEFNGDGDGLLEDDEEIQISWSASDASGISETTVSLEGCAVNSVNGLTEAAANLGPCEVGNYPFEISAADGDNSPETNTWQGNFDVAAHAPVIDSVSPENNALNISLSSTVQVTFTYGIEATSFFTDTFLLQTMAGAPITGTVSFDGITQSGTLVPDQLLDTDTTYKATLKGGAGGIVDKNNNVLETDYVWQFTTVQNQAPDLPFNPNPGNTQADVALDSSLLWQATDPENDQLTFDVYLDTVDPPVSMVCTDTDLYSCTPAALNPDETYYWRVDATDEHGASHTGTVWNFTTEAAPPGCFVLTVTHTGIGTDPAPTPVNSDGCSAGMYVAGAIINFSDAEPGEGYLIDGWSGTDHDDWATTNNELTMPATNHEAAVNYVPIIPCETGQLILLPTADSYTSSRYPSKNYGASSLLKAKDAAQELKSYLQFEVAGTSGANIESATLRLYVVDSSNDLGKIYSTNNAWTEAAITWNSAPASGALLDDSGDVDGKWVEFDVTGAVTGDGIFSFVLESNSKDLVTFRSSEATNPPQMIVNYSVPGNEPVAADFSYQPDSPIIGRTVQFTDDSTGCPSSWNWDFGDGGTSTEKNPSHTFTGLGSHDVELTVNNDKSVIKAIVVQEPLPETFFVSSSSNGNTGGVIFKDEDILAYDPATGEWSMFLDGSDVGLGSSAAQDIDAFHIMDDGSILISIVGAANIPDAGRIDDSDIVRFVPVSTGENSAGTFELYFDGSDVELSLSGEDVDAISILENGDLLISTSGNWKAGGMIGKDEDLLRFSPTALGDVTSGSWSLFFDGSDVELTTTYEDIWGTWYDVSQGDIYLTTFNRFIVTGARGDGADILHCSAFSLGDDTGCAFDLYWDGSAFDFAGEKMDGLFIGR